MSKISQDEGGHTGYNLRERNSTLNQKRLEFQQIINEAKKEILQNDSNMLVKLLTEKQDPNQDHKVLSKTYFSQQEPDNRPDYEHIICNDTSLVNRSQTNAPINRGNSRWICDCQMPTKESLLDGNIPCMSECINRALNIECGHRCPVYEICGNRRFQRMEYAPVEPFFSGPNKGWGLRAKDFIEKGTFLIEYVGEVITFKEFQRRIRRYERHNSPHHYFMSSGPNFFIDAAKKGNWARFINHSCQPNAETQKWNVLGSTCIGIFAIEDIQKEEEITMDYQFIQFGAKEQKCYCGFPNCSGIMGVSSKNFQDKVCTKDTSGIEKRALRLLSLDKLRTSHEITLLLQIMVQECLTQFARYRLLGLLKSCANDSLYTLFRQYNGLELIASYMCDSEPTDWPIKKRIIECLLLIPITERKQINTESRISEIVDQWSKDPRYCRARIDSANDNPLSQEEKALADEACEDWMDDCEIVNIVHSSSNGEQQNSSEPSSSSSSSDQPIVITIDDEEGSEPGTSPKSPAPTTKDLGSILSQEVAVQQESANWIEPTTREEVMELASVLLKKWEEIPLESYRIPRKERQVTEELLMDQEELSSPDSSSKQHKSPYQQQQAPNTCLQQEKEAPSKIKDTKRKVREANRRSENAERRQRHREIFEKKIKQLEDAKLRRKIREEQLKRLEASIKNLDKMNSKQLLKIICKALAIHLTKLKSLIVNNGNSLDQETLYRLNSLTQELSRRLPTLYQMDDITGAVLLLVEMTDDCEAIQEIVDNLFKKQKIIREKMRNGEHVKSTKRHSQTHQPQPVLKRTPEETKSNLQNSGTHLDPQPALTLEPGLPSGWQTGLDPMSGHRFYYNISLGITQWIYPSVPIVKIETSSIPLPPPPQSIPPPPPPPPVLKSSVEYSSREKSRTTAPNNSNNQQDPDSSDRYTSSHHRNDKLFIQISSVVKKTLKPYTLSNCVTGRITCHADYCHLVKKFSYDFNSKLKASKNPDPKLSKGVVDKLRSAITKYMLSKGSTYERSKPKSIERANL